jgi:hypothetical protein
VEYPNFCGGSFESLSGTAETERTTNFYVEVMESPGATAKRILLPTPGVDEVADHLSGSGRAHFVFSGREFAVIGSAFVEYDVNGTETSHGTVANDGLPATISSNGDAGGELLITAGGTAYVFTLATNVLAAVGSPPWAWATMGASLDGYGLVLDATTSTFYVSDLLDMTTWSASQKAERSLAPDPWVAMEVRGRYLILAGDRTSEVWYNIGAASSFPFAPYATGVVQYGSPAPWSLAVVGDSVCWLAQTAQGGPEVVEMAGFTPEKISTTALEETLGQYDDVTDAIGDAFTYMGHTFYVLTFVEADATHVYDFTSRQWTKLGTWEAAQNRFTAWAPRWHAWVFGRHRVLDSTSGKLFDLSIEHPNDANGEPIVRERQPPALMLENRRLFVSLFELDLEPGLGVLSGQGEDPQVMLQISRDGGKTWGTEQMRSAGRQGHYGARVRWLRCGSGRRLVFKVRMSDPIPWRIANAFVTLSGEGVPA